MLAKQNLRRCSRINHYNRNIAQLYLVNSTISTGPLSIFLGGVLSNLPEIPYKRKAPWSVKTNHSGLPSNDFIDQNVEDWNQKEGHSQSLQGILDGFDMSCVEEVADSHFPCLK